MNAALDIRELILYLRAPTITPEFETLHARLLEVKVRRPDDHDALNDILNECKDAECIVCGAIICPHEEPLHFHHDGCPACSNGGM